jgi:hypothetical protein
MIKKMKILTYGLLIFFLVGFALNDLAAQSIDAIPSSSSCEAGGKIWVCGTSQVAKAHSDFNRNCANVNYPCGGKTIKTVVDVCSPIMTESKITSEICSFEEQ